LRAIGSSPAKRGTGDHALGSGLRPAQGQAAHGGGGAPEGAAYDLPPPPPSAVPLPGRKATEEELGRACDPVSMSAVPQPRSGGRDPSEAWWRGFSAAALPPSRMHPSLPPSPFGLRRTSRSTAFDLPSRVLMGEVTSVSAVPHPRRGGGGPPKAVVGADEKRSAHLRPLNMLRMVPLPRRGGGGANKTPKKKTQTTQ
jgi:hypothetical protein